jgi:hypothetical protein
MRHNYLGRKTLSKPVLTGGDAPPEPEIAAGTKVLVLGSTGHANVTAVPWSAQLPNIVDFHVCVVVTKTLSDDFIREMTSEYFEAIAAKLRRLLLSGGKVVVLGDQFRRVARPKKHPENMSNYEWAPFDLRFRSETGDTVEARSRRFPGFLGRLKRWTFHYQCAAIDDAWIRNLEEKQKWSIDTNALAVNREGRLLCGTHRVQLYDGRWVSSGFESVVQYPGRPSRVTGEFVYLSPLQDTDEREEVSLLLADFGLKIETPPPEWVEKVEVPGVPELLGKLAGASAEIRKLETARGELEAELQKLKRWGRLLYATGAELEEIFRESLILLGGRVEEAKYAKEEYILHIPGGEILVEVKGNTKSISLDNVRQILDYTVHYLKDTNKEGKGVLFGNAWRLLPPDQRDTRDKPYFPDDVKRTAAKHGIALLSSKDYFAVFCRFLKGEVPGAEILKKLESTNGVVVF